MTSVIDHQGEQFFPREYCTAMVSCKGRPLSGPRPGGGKNAACNPCSLSWNRSRTAALILCLSVGFKMCFPCQLHLEISGGMRNLWIQAYWIRNYGDGAWHLSFDGRSRCTRKERASAWVMAAQWQRTCCQCRRRKGPGFNPWVGKILWRREWQPTPVFMPGKSLGKRILVGYSPWGHKESDRTEHACTPE